MDDMMGKLLKKQGFTDFDVVERRKVLGSTLNLIWALGLRDRLKNLEELAGNPALTHEQWWRFVLHHWKGHEPALDMWQ